LPHARSFFWKARHGQALGGLRRRLCYSGARRFVGRNLTSDKETGLGSWTREQIATAITTGKRPDGRVLAPVMPWRAYAQLTRMDALAIAAYLQSLPPVRHDVPGPFGPNEDVSVFAMDVLPANVHNGLQPSANGQPAPN